MIHPAGGGVVVIGNDEQITDQPHADSSPTWILTADGAGPLLA
jgi:hypothetical protein